MDDPDGPQDAPSNFVVDPPSNFVSGTYIRVLGVMCCNWALIGISNIFVLASYDSRFFLSLFVFFEQYIICLEGKRGLVAVEKI